MGIFVLSIPIIFVLRTYAKELMTPIGNKQDLMHKVVHKVVDELLDRMQDQRLPQQQAHLGNTRFGKPAMPCVPSGKSFSAGTSFSASKTAGKSSGSSGAKP